MALPTLDKYLAPKPATHNPRQENFLELLEEATKAAQEVPDTARTTPNPKPKPSAPDPATQPQEPTPDTTHLHEAPKHHDESKPCKQTPVHEIPHTQNPFMEVNSRFFNQTAPHRDRAKSQFVNSQVSRPGGLPSALEQRWAQSETTCKSPVKRSFEEFEYKSNKTKQAHSGARPAKTKPSRAPSVVSEVRIEPIPMDLQQFALRDRNRNRCNR